LNGSLLASSISLGLLAKVLLCIFYIRGFLVTDLEIIFLFLLFATFILRNIISSGKYIHDLISLWRSLEDVRKYLWLLFLLLGSSLFGLHLLLHHWCLFLTSPSLLLSRLGHLGVFVLDDFRSISGARIFS